MSSEPLITIWGKELTIGQSMTIRVAIEVFNDSLNKGLGEDNHGKEMVELYRKRINEIRNLMFGML